MADTNIPKEELERIASEDHTLWYLTNQDAFTEKAPYNNYTAINFGTIACEGIDKATKTVYNAVQLACTSLSIIGAILLALGKYEDTLQVRRLTYRMIGDRGIYKGPDEIAVILQEKWQEFCNEIGIKISVSIKAKPGGYEFARINHPDPERGIEIVIISRYEHYLAVIPNELNPGITEPKNSSQDEQDLKLAMEIMAQEQVEADHALAMSLMEHDYQAYINPDNAPYAYPMYD